MTTQLPVVAVGNGHMQLNWTGLGIPFSPWSMNINNGFTHSIIAIGTDTYTTIPGNPGSTYSITLFTSGRPTSILGSAIIIMPIYNLYVGPIDETTIGITWSRGGSLGPADLYTNGNLTVSAIFPPYYFHSPPGQTYSVVITDNGDPSQSSSTTLAQTTPVSLIYGTITGSTYSIIIQDSTGASPYSINLNGTSVGTTSGGYYLGSTTESTLNSLVVYNTNNQISTTHVFYSSFDVYISKLTPFELYINWTNPNSNYTIFVNGVSAYTATETKFVVPLTPETSYKIYVQDNQAVSSNYIFITAPATSFSFGINNFFSPVLV
jgi:hypothetical protein